MKCFEVHPGHGHHKQLSDGPSQSVAPVAAPQISLASVPAKHSSSGTAIYSRTSRAKLCYNLRLELRACLMG